jgi:hypothetical protein
LKINHLATLKTTFGFSTAQNTLCRLHEYSELKKNSKNNLQCTSANSLVTDEQGDQIGRIIFFGQFF